MSASTKIEVRDISAEETRPMRVRILRPGAPVEDVVFPGDDDELTLHVGAYVDGELLGITSVYCEPRPDAPAGASGEWRLRGVATEAKARRTGVASALMERCSEHVRANGGSFIWCNARTPAIPFYRAHGFEVVGEEFDIPGAGPHFVAQRHV